MEFQDTWGVMVGEEGRGIRTIIEMVTGNRLYCAMASAAGIMRQALVQALHHTTHRSAFQKRLIQQPLMQNVLADMAVEVEAALALGLRVAQKRWTAWMTRPRRRWRGSARRWRNTGTPNAARAWWSRLSNAMAARVCRGKHHAPALPRSAAQLDLGRVGQCDGLDVLRAMGREAEAIPAVMAELEKARGNHPNLDRAIDDLRD